jgi:hypothetical protein
MELSLKPTSAKVKDYYNALNQFGQLNIIHETAVRQAFASLLDTCAKQFKWKLVQEFRLPAAGYLTWVCPKQIKSRQRTSLFSKEMGIEHD